MASSAAAATLKGTPPRDTPKPSKGKTESTGKTPADQGDKKDKIKCSKSSSKSSQKRKNAGGKVQGYKRRPLSHYVSRRPMRPLKLEHSTPTDEAPKTAGMDSLGSCSLGAGSYKDGAVLGPARPPPSPHAPPDSAEIYSESSNVPSLRKLYEIHAAAAADQETRRAARWLQDSDRPPLFVDDDQYNLLARRVEDALEQGVEPQLIQAGSSGSYFVRTPALGERGPLRIDASDKQPPHPRDIPIVAVFKPKDEEPFAPLNPKWPKMVQVDDWLALDIVPKTRLVWLASSTFNYPQPVRSKVHLKGKQWPAKIGSMQMFVTNYQPAGHWLKRFAANDPALTKKEFDHFVVLFQKMVVLDYVIRNTDRSHANWLVAYDEKAAQAAAASSKVTWLRIAAIDNGLAFPIKHPFEVSYWRPFPFYWASLQPYADVPFDAQLTTALLPLLDDARFVEDMCAAMQAVFKQDTDFNMMHFRAQMSVIKGQIANLRVALKQKMSPAELAKIPAQIAMETAAGKRVRRDRVAMAKMEAAAVAHALHVFGEVPVMPGAPPSLLAARAAKIKRLPALPEEATQVSDEETNDTSHTVGAVSGQGSEYQMDVAPVEKQSSKMIVKKSAHKMGSNTPTQPSLTAVLSAKLASIPRPFATKRELPPTETSSSKMAVDFETCYKTREATPAVMWKRQRIKLNTPMALHTLVDIDIQLVPIAIQSLPTSRRTTLKRKASVQNGRSPAAAPHARSCKN